mgnify:CR=1 FL=1
METAACLVGRIIKLTSGVEGCKYKTLRGNAFLVHANRDTSAIIRNSGGASLFNVTMDLTAKTGQMLVHRVVNNLVDKMVQALRETLPMYMPGRLRTPLDLPHGNTVGIIRIGWCHNKKSFQKVVAR